MKLSEYVDEAHGRQTELAKDLRCPSQLVWQWARAVRPVPIERCPEIERATAGRVSRRELRPTDWHRIWPELVTDEFPAPEEARDAA